ncbi:hypothetical protein F5Y17DRAFT_429369 [Xylariaceae sp. FL0594]|nr:hypothetical protein F5Y17DRAFT_429369 [Xylariaceae sp. FL0594]
MASTRASSPVSDMSNPTSPQLTPRSKIKAMLADIDRDGSDDESTKPIDTKLLFAKIDKQKESLPVATPSGDHDASEEDDEDDEIFRPRGRVAARMHAGPTKVDQPSKSPSSTPRAVSPVGTSPARESSNAARRETPAFEEEEDDDIVGPTKRRQTRHERETSPGLFVSSPVRDPEEYSASDDEELPSDLSKSTRFQELVQRKRQERLEKEAQEVQKRKERAQQLSEQNQMGSDADEVDVSDISDDEGGRKLTQDASRPARKASKKVLEEMNRETQRMSRSLQLAPEARTKKKLNKSSLFQRFNFQVDGNGPEAQKGTASSSRPTTPGQTDAEVEADGTPPSSPPTPAKSALDPSTTTTTEPQITPAAAPDDDDDDEELLSLEDALAQMKQSGKGKEKATPATSVVPEAEKLPNKKALRQVRVKLPPMQVNAVVIDSDEELEITDSKTKDKLEAVFARVPEKRIHESNGMKMLRSLAHISSPSKEPARTRNAKPAMTFGELHMSLQQRAKAQAKAERERRLEMLRAKGVVVQTAEEREREQELVEDLVSKARQEAEEIMAREREDAKKARKEKEQKGEADPLAWDDSDDESFQAEDEELELNEVELSGSEEEREEGEDETEAVDEPEDEDASNEEDNSLHSPMLVQEAEEESSDDDTEARAFVSRRAKKHVQILSDDEDEAERNIKTTPKAKQSFPKSPSAPGSRSPKLPTSVLRSATKTFIPGLPIAPAAPAGLGLTQIFAGTMDDSQPASFPGSVRELNPSLDQFPDSQFSATAGQSQANEMVADTQALENGETETQALHLHYTQSQFHGFDSLIQPDTTQLSEFLDPTQDRGLQDLTPLKQRFVEPTQLTEGTQLITSTPGGASVQDSPLVRKKGKLLRRGDLATSEAAFLSAVVPESPKSTIRYGTEAATEGTSASDAFKLMEKAAAREKRLKKKFDKKKSKATEMVEEQAEESEDEYAGLGGADGEDSNDEDEELMKELIDDTGENDGDIEKLAGLFADREREADAAQVDKLFRDITTGMLRKRRRGGDGHDFDLSDSDDGGEARRRLKRQKFAKMQKALFADERIGKIAENPRNAAFLKSIEDRNDDEDWDFGENFVDTATSTSDTDSQSQTANPAEQAIPDSQPPTTGRKRSRMDDHALRPGPGERRSGAGARPASIAEVRRSLTALLDEPNASLGSVIPATDVGSDEDEDGERPTSSRSNQENREPVRRATVSAVVDRITLKRNSSSLSTSSSGSGRLAFTASSTGGSSGGFKVPALLRRATTNSKNLAASSAMTGLGSGTSQSSSTSSSLNKAAGFGDEQNGKLKKNAGKRSGINYFAHENERRAKVADAEKRREARKWKGAEGRSKVVGGLFGSGSFE